MRSIDLLVIHHSETLGGNIDFLRYCHVTPPPKGNGWMDVGYHYTIANGKKHYAWEAAGDGYVEEGRPEKNVGAHARGFNEHSIGICLIGDFENTYPTNLQLASLVELLIKLCLKYDIDPMKGIRTHGELMETKCPGKNLQHLIPTIRQAVRLRIDHQKRINKAIEGLG